MIGFVFLAWCTVGALVIAAGVARRLDDTALILQSLYLYRGQLNATVVLVAALVLSMIAWPVQLGGARW